LERSNRLNVPAPKAGALPTALHLDRHPMKLTDSKAIHLYRAQIALQPTLSALSGCKQNWRFATPAKQLRYTWISLYFKGFFPISQGEKPG